MKRTSYDTSSSSSNRNKRIFQNKRIFRDSSSPEENKSEGVDTLPEQTRAPASDNVEKTLVAVKNALARLTEEVFSMRMELKRLRMLEENGATTAQNILDRPLSDERELEELEEKLQEDEFFNGMVTYLRTLSAKTPEAYIRKAFHCIFQDSLAEQYTWLGTKDKKAAKNLLVIAAIRGSFQRIYAQNALSTVEEVGKKYFHYAHDRLMKKKQIAASSSCLSKLSRKRQ